MNLPLSILTAGLVADANEGGIYYAFVHSDAVGQGIVVILLIFSVITWCVMLIKFLGLKEAWEDSYALLRDLRKHRDPMSLNLPSGETVSPAAEIFRTAWRTMGTLYGSEEALRGGRRRALKETEQLIVRGAMEETVSEQILVLEKRIIFLMTAVSISPFLGLFGTVWGIMLAFVAMAMQGKPDVSTLAPGVSGALLTTVLGLVVAIPSLIGYNVIGQKVRNITVLMDNFVEEFIGKLKMEQLTEEKTPNDPYAAAGTDPRRSYAAQPYVQQVPPPAPQPVYQSPVQQTPVQQPVQNPGYPYPPQQTVRQTPVPQQGVPQYHPLRSPQNAYQQPSVRPPAGVQMPQEAPQPGIPGLDR